MKNSGTHSLKYFLFFFLIFNLSPLIVACSSTGATSTNDSPEDVGDNSNNGNEDTDDGEDNDEEEDEEEGDEGDVDEGEDSNDEEPILTEKLIGTPFEGMIIGDDIGWCQFQQGQYQTTSIESLPIPIFLAFFTASEEEIVREGVEVANESIGLEAFEVVDTWDDKNRIIYKVSFIYDESSPSPESHFNNVVGRTPFLSNLSGTYDRMVLDWQIEIRDLSFDKWLIAHELGHASGIGPHALLDYTNRELDDLEDGSIMEPSGGTDPPVLIDYSSMMQTQFSFVEQHINNGSNAPAAYDGTCDDYAP